MQVSLKPKLPKTAATQTRLQSVCARHVVCLGRQPTRIAALFLLVP